MGRVLTNNMNLSYSIESALGVAGTDWVNIEPNDITTFGAVITTVARQPISKNRQRRKGVVTDLDSSVEFDEDLTLSAFRDFIEGYCFATGINSDVSDLITTAATAAGSLYTLNDAINADQAEKFEIGTLIYVKGFSTAANNGLKSIAVDAADTDTTLTVNETLVDESPAPSAARLSFSGQRILTAATPTWDYDAPNNQATLNSTGWGTLATQLGLTPGEFVHIGSPDSSGTIQNAFENTAANDMFGYARVVSVSADDVVFDKLDEALKFDDLTAPATDIDVLFGEFIRNVTTSATDFLERSFQFEAEFPNLDTNGDPKYQYALGNYCNTAGFNMPLTDKATITYGFTGTDTENPVPLADRKDGTTTTSATGILTFTGQPADTETVTIGTQTYTFQTVFVDAADNVEIGATASDSLDNLIAAINLGAGAGVVYGTATTLNADVTAVAGAGDTMDVTAKTAGEDGNLVVTTTTVTLGSWGAATLTGGFDGALDPTDTAAFSTTSDIARLRITDVDEAGLTTDFKSMTITLNNNVSPEKVLGVLGAKFLNTGNFEVDIEAQLIFTNSEVIDRIRDNVTVTMEFFLFNDDGVILMDIPSMTLGDGSYEFPVNESVLLNTTGQAFQDDTLNTSIGVSIIPVPLG